MPSRMRSRPSARVTQPWSMAMQMAEMPKPWAAMLHGEPGWLRSRIRPLTGLASSQKYSKAVRCRLSSRAGGGQRLAPAANAASAPAEVAAVSDAATSQQRQPDAGAWFASCSLSTSCCHPLPLVLSAVSKLDDHGDPVRVLQILVAGPGVVQLVAVVAQIARDAEAEGQPQLAVGLEQGLVADPQGQQPLAASIRRPDSCSRCCRSGAGLRPERGRRCSSLTS